MPVSIVVGGQYGSEGKGKVAYFWADKMNAAAVVRVGGSNSGHTVYGANNEQYAFRMLPTASILKDKVVVLPAGAYLDVSVLMDEIRLTGISQDRLKIDPNAAIITEEHKERERGWLLRSEIGSTQSGTGAAVMDRILRSKSHRIMMAKDVPELQPYLTDTKIYMRQLLLEGKHIVIEGTQGYGLSNYHAKDYPYATSRDTTAAGFLAETGLSPFDVEHVVMVIRAFPIRVAGESGPLEDEVDWTRVSQESGSPEYFEEKTTVTHMVRRVARFTPDIVTQALSVNHPDVIVLNHMDYMDASNKNGENLSDKQEIFLREVEKQIGRSVTYCGNGEMSMIFMEKNG